MGNFKSTRWKGYAKKLTVEECHRITPPEAQHVGAATTETKIAHTTARRLWCECPSCSARVFYLYQLPEGGAWKCKTCHQLIYKGSQAKGTRAAFAAWLTPQRWERICKTHPAHDEMYERFARDFKRICEPFDWEKCSNERRAELLEAYGSREAIRRVWESKRDRLCGAPLIKIEHATGKKIYADVWQEWKQRNRTTRSRSTPVTMEAGKIKESLL